jgi:hypothetical protein
VPVDATQLPVCTSTVSVTGMPVRTDPRNGMDPLLLCHSLESSRNSHHRCSLARIPSPVDLSYFLPPLLKASPPDRRSLFRHSASAHRPFEGAGQDHISANAGVQIADSVVLRATRQRSACPIGTLRTSDLHPESGGCERLGVTNHIVSQRTSEIAAEDDEMIATLRESAPYKSAVDAVSRPYRSVDLQEYLPSRA